MSKKEKAKKNKKKIKMGHIVSAKSLRLGWNENWVDTWFSESQFYSEYLHCIYKIRFFFNLYVLQAFFRKRRFFFLVILILLNFIRDCK